MKMKSKGSMKKSSAQSQKKAKKKSGMYKVSIGKLNNKKNNRLAKQGKLKPRIKKKDRNNQNTEKDQKALNEKEAELAESEEDQDSGSEKEISDEDTSCFTHMKNAWGFSQTNLSNGEKEKAKSRKRKNVEEEDENERDFEQNVRTFASEEDNSDMKMMLPIISNGKVIKRMMKKDKTDEADEEEDEMVIREVKEKEENLSDKREKEEAYMKTLNSAQLFAYRDGKLKEKKSKISALSHDILENPQENIKKLKELRLLLGETDSGVSLTVRKYAMVSLMEVFKDIVPGYRLRVPTEKESANKLKQETKSLMDYESAFLLNYHIYLEFLETMAKVKSIPEKSFLAKHGIRDLKIPGSSKVGLGALAVKCLCEMLVNHPHFNYRDNIINVIVHFTNHGLPEYSDPACDAVKTVFETDKRGDVILEIVKSIGRMAKRLEYDVRPQVLLTFLSLRIKDVDLSSINTKLEKMKKKEKMRTLSRKERKNLKLKEKLDKEMLETKATEDKSQILKLHTQIIQTVFETYIRVIKLASDSISLSPVLEGLAQFAHLINIEYFDSLFAAFTRLIESGDLTTRETLHCLQTAFTILSGQGAVLNIDPTNFYKHLYATLLDVHVGSIEETAPIVLECLDVMINKRRKQVSQQRVLAFMKRLCSLCLHQSPEAMIGYLASVRNFLHTYKHADILVDADVQGSGVYLPLLEDPEHCCANSTSLWELHLLRHHYEPDVKKFAQHILKAAPLSGEHQLSMELSRASAKELYSTYHNEDLFSGKKIPATFSKKKKSRSRNGFADSEFETYTTQIFDSVKSYEEEATGPEEEESAMDVS